MNTINIFILSIIWAVLSIWILVYVIKQQKQIAAITRKEKLLHPEKKKMIKIYKEIREFILLDFLVCFISLGVYLAEKSYFFLFVSVLFCFVGTVSIIIAKKTSPLIDEALKSLRI